MRRFELVLILSLSGCAFLNNQSGHYSDKYVEFSFPTTAQTNSLSSEAVTLAIQKEENGKITKIFLRNKNNLAQKGSAYVQIFAGESEEEADGFLQENILAEHCSYRTEEYENGIEELIIFEKNFDPAGPFCNRSAFRLFKKENVIIYKYTGQECTFINDHPEAQHECEEFINFRVK